MNEELKRKIAEFEEALGKAHELREEILDYLEELTNESKYDFANAIENDCDYVYGFDYSEIEELLKGE